jgi:predicted amidohydrolase
VAANLAELERAAWQAAEAGVDLLITPEMYLTGYAIGRAALERLAQQDLVPELGRIACQASVALIVGGPQRAPEGIYNAAFCVGQSGELAAVHPKSHLFGELDRALFVAGDDLFARFRVRDVEVAVMICYDVDFPESVRAAALAGAHLVAVPTAQMAPFELVADVVVRTRAWENQVYVTYANRVGAEGSLTYVGRSSIVAPDGRVLDSMTDGEGLLVETVDGAAVVTQQQRNPYLAGRRLNLYSVPRE